MRKPQSVATVINQQMVDAGDLNLKDALNQAPGLTTTSLYGDARWHFFARGSQVSNLQYDGVTLDASGQELSPGDMVIYDRVEIVRGATGLMDGAGDPSASVNLVRKRQLAPALHMIAGGRLAWYETSASFGNPQLGPRGSCAFKVDAEPIPYLGLVYDVNDTVSVYASYTEIFRPQSNKDRRGVQLAPATGKNTELGVKAALFDGGLQGTAALFDTRMDGLPERIADSSQCFRPADGCYRAAETVVTRGADIELAGSPAPGRNVSLGYTYADAAYDAGPRKGQRYNADRIPRHVAKLSATYAFQDDLDGAQSGVQYDGTAPTGDAYRSKQGGYAVVDAMARYDFAQDAVLQVNIDNLLGREYLTGVDLGWPNLFYGQPRTVSLSLRKAF